MEVTIGMVGEAIQRTAGVLGSLEIGEEGEGETGTGDTMMRITPGCPLPTQPDEALRAISHNNRTCKMIIVSSQAATATKVTIGS
jgi:hypothetical protein